MKNSWFLVIISLAFACNAKPEKSQSGKKTDAVLRVKAAPVTSQTMIDTVWIYGDVKLRWEAQLASQFDGRLTEFTLLIGDPIKKGQKISTIIPPAREALLQIKDQMAPEVRPLLERQIKSVDLYSPINGIVLELWHHNGDVVQKGVKIIHIGNLEVLDVLGDLPVRYIPLLKSRKTVMVTFVDFPYKPMSLKLEAISGMVNEKNQTVLIRCGLPNRQRIFRPGLRVRMYFPGETHKNTVVIPRDALLEEEGVFSAFVLKGDHAEKRQIKVGIIGYDKIEVLSGVKENEQVITEKAYSLTDGMKVIVE